MLTLDCIFVHPQCYNIVERFSFLIYGSMLEVLNKVQWLSVYCECSSIFCNYSFLFTLIKKTRFYSIIMVRVMILNRSRWIECIPKMVKFCPLGDVPIAITLTSKHFIDTWTCTDRHYHRLEKRIVETVLQLDKFLPTGTITPVSELQQDVS